MTSDSASPDGQDETGKDGTGPEETGPEETGTAPSHGLDALFRAARPGTRPGGLAPGRSPRRKPRRPITRPTRRRIMIVALAVLVPLLLAFAVIVAWYGTTRKPLTALPGLSSEKMPHYLFSMYGVARPIGVAVTASGDQVYVTQSDGTRVVQVYDHSGNKIGVLKPPDSTGKDHIPVYVAINPANGDVYVSDRFTAEIYIYSQAGKYLRTFAPRGDVPSGWAPLGLAFDRDGLLYVTDVGGPSHYVRIFGPDGTLRRSIGAHVQLSFPNGLVIDGKGNLEVSDSNNGRVLIFNPAGKVIAAITRGVGDGDLGMPRGAAVDDSGRLYVVDTSNHAVRVYRVGDAKSPVPKYIGSFGDEGTLDGLFEYPNGAATDSRARIYITDRENDRVQVWGY